MDLCDNLILRAIAEEVDRRGDEAGAGDQRGSKENCAWNTHKITESVPAVPNTANHPGLWKNVEDDSSPVKWLLYRCCCVSC